MHFEDEGFEISIQQDNNKLAGVFETQLHNYSEAEKLLVKFQSFREKIINIKAEKKPFLRKDKIKYKQKIEDLQLDITKTYAELCEVIKKLKESDCAVNFEYSSPLGLYIALSVAKQNKVFTVQAFTNYFHDVYSRLNEEKSIDAVSVVHALRQSKDETDNFWEKAENIKNDYEYYCHELRDVQLKLKC